MTSEIVLPELFYFKNRWTRWI